MVTLVGVSTVWVGRKVVRDGRELRGWWREKKRLREMEESSSVKWGKHEEMERRGRELAGR